MVVRGCVKQAWGWLGAVRCGGGGGVVRGGVVRGGGS